MRINLLPLVNLDIINKIREGLAPDEAIRLAYTNPAFKTAMSTQIHNEEFAVACIVMEIHYCISHRMHDEALLKEKELTKLMCDIELGYEHYSLINKLRRRREDEFMQMLRAERLKQLDQYMKMVQSIISSNMILINQINERLSELLEQKIKVENEISHIEKDIRDVVHSILSDFKIKDKESFFDSENDEANFSYFLQDIERDMRDLVAQSIIDNIDVLGKLPISNYHTRVSDYVKNKYHEHYYFLPQDMREEMVHSKMSLPKTTALISTIVEDLSRYTTKIGENETLRVKQKALLERKAVLADIEQSYTKLEREKDNLVHDNEILQSQLVMLEESKANLDAPMDDIVQSLLKQMQAEANAAEVIPETKAASASTTSSIMKMLNIRGPALPEKELASEQTEKAQPAMETKPSQVLTATEEKEEKPQGPRRSF